MATLNVNGTRERRPEPSELGRGLEGRIVVKDAARVQTARAGAPQISIEGLPDDVVEIELQDGLRIWSRLDDLTGDFARRGQRGQTADSFDMPSELTVGPASRSWGGWAIKTLKVLGIDIEEEIADFVAAHVEGRLQPGPGLYRCAEEDPSRLAPVSSLDGKGPILLFLHGNASSTSGSFSGLWTIQGGGLIRPLFNFYGGRVLAYQHRTLTESPIGNALALARALADLVEPDAEIHVVSHSRGGLIGELLARGMRVGAAPFTPDELVMFEEESRARDRVALEELSGVLERSRIRLTRFVRVACPARGTTLADRRLDRYFSVLVNLVSLIPALKGNPVYEGLTSVLAGVLKKRTEPEDLPGLEAMMPTSPLVRMLNNPDVRTAADLHVLGGDLAGIGVFGRLKTLATDFYYRDDHDVVVNTPAMLGGIERTQPVRYWIDTGDQVTHFHYFMRTDTAQRLASALTGSSTEYRTLEARPSSVTSADYVKRAALARPVVFVLPGIMGSQLTVDDRPVWMNVLELARGGLSLLAGESGITATGLLPDAYAALCAHLDATHEVVPFPYDWRQSLDHAAESLRTALDGMLPRAETAQQPIRLLAHSMGGLVVRAMLADRNGQQTWARMCEHPGARFIMLGTPNGGTHAIPAMLIGRDALVKKLALVDLRSDHASLLETIAGFDGVLNLLPHDGGSLDFFDPEAWQRLLDLDAPETRGLFPSRVTSAKSAGFRWALPADGALRRARQMTAAVANSPLDPARVVYVAGVAAETACDLAIDESARTGRKVTVMATSRGDGRVLWDTGIPKGIRSFYMDTVHGDMARDRRHFAAIVDLLNTGTTGRLPTTPPTRRDAGERFEMREPMPAMVPDEAELVSAALGGSREPVEIEAHDTRIAIRVVHDNLTNARFPALVSHYRHDVIVAAEAYLDNRLDGRLSELLRMELYPGPVNTAVVVLNEPLPGDLSIHPGAIVAGLGNVGELTPGSLTSTLAHALTFYGAECAGRARRRQQREGLVPGSTVSAPVTAILIGSGEGGLSLADSVRALLRAVLQANQRLREAAAGRSDESGSLITQINQIDILELYEDRAIEGLHVLRALSEAPEFDAFLVSGMLVKGSGGRRRVRFDQAAAWWQRIRVVAEEDGALRFEAVTQTARAPIRLRPTQRDLVDGFVQQALETTANDRTLGQTLFELLVPTDFKPYAPDRRKLALMLNAEAAAIPWELIRDGFDRSPEPMSVSSGMIRQLLLTDGRTQVLRAPSNTALVVGNPLVADDRFPSLAGAAEEATSIATQLTDRGYDVDLLLEGTATPMAVLSAVHKRPWRVLHLAAHGVFAFTPAAGKRPVSGLVLDDGLFFTAEEAEQIRHVPELVFINCCHLGQTRADATRDTAFHRLAANLATQFIRIGARAVIAAGWAVDDAAAKTFATSFYRRMLDGDLYGDAVLQARRDTYQKHGETNTWGAYQCYGDPSFSLAAGSVERRDQRFVSESELCSWLEGLTASARQDGGAGTTLLTELEDIASQTPADWWTSASVCALAGSAAAELGRFDKAIDYYERMLEAEKATGPIAAVEQLASCRIRWAGLLLEQQPPDSDKARALLERAEDAVRHLLALGETSERWSLLASAMKRRALVPGIDATTRRTALREMSDAYRAAYQLSKKSGPGNAHPLGNQIAADVVMSWRDRANIDDAEVAAAIAELEQLAMALAGTHTDTFNLAAAADRLLLSALLRRDLDDGTRDRIAQAYAAAISRGATPKERDSMRTQFRFFRRLAETEFSKEGRARMIKQLTHLELKVLGDAPQE